MSMTIKVLVLVIMLGIAYQDFKNKEISSVGIILCAGLSVVSVVCRLCLGESFTWPLIALLPGIGFSLLALVTRGSVGIGDGLLLMGIGPAFGIEHTILGVFVALGLTSVTSIILLVSKKGNGKSRLPFVPFLTLGMGVMMLA